MLDDLEVMLRRAVAKRTMMALVDAIRSHLDEHPELRRELWNVLGALRQPGTRKKSEPAIVYEAPKKRGYRLATLKKNGRSKGKPSEVLLSYVLKAEGPVRVLDAAKATGLEYKIANATLQRLTKVGKLKKSTQRGYYAAP